MAHIVAKKSYILIDTPETCIDCPLGHTDGEYPDLSVVCPLLNTHYSMDAAGECRDENCPLKSIEFEAKFDV